MRKKDRIVELLLQGGLNYEAIAKIVGCYKSTVHHHAKKLGLIQKKPRAKKYDWAEVQAYYDSVKSSEATLEHFGMSPRTWQKARNRGDIIIRPEHKNYNSVAKPTDHLLVSDRPMTSRYDLKRRLLRDGKLKNHCYVEGCPLHGQENPIWCGEPLTLRLDHINGKSNDNRLENLRMICSNCDRQTSTFAGRNANKRLRDDLKKLKDGIAKVRSYPVFGKDYHPYAYVKDGRFVQGPEEEFSQTATYSTSPGVPEELSHRFSIEIVGVELADRTEIINSYPASVARKLMERAGIELLPKKS